MVRSPVNEIQMRIRRNEDFADHLQGLYDDKRWIPGINYGNILVALETLEELRSADYRALEKLLCPLRAHEAGPRSSR